MDELTQQQDRVTEILRNRTKQPTMQDYNALAAANMYNPAAFAREAYGLDFDRQQQALNDEMQILSIFEKRKAAGDAQAKALDDKIKLFAGEDPQGMALFLKELHNDPDPIDPGNSYQVMTKLAQIQKRTGYKNPDMLYEEQKRRMDVQQPSTASMPKAPSGYRYAADGKSLEPIPGGPAEKLPAELSARIGLADKFLKELPDIKKGISAGEATGAWDYMKGALGRGESGKLQRRISDGAEALLRLLTGAGMNQLEAEDYVKRFRVSPTDSAEILLDKVNNLEQNLKSIMQNTMKGRGSVTDAQPDFDPTDLEFMTPEERALFE